VKSTKDKVVGNLTDATSDGSKRRDGKGSCDYHRQRGEHGSRRMARRATESRNVASLSRRRVTTLGVSRRSPCAGRLPTSEWITGTVEELPAVEAANDNDSNTLPPSSDSWFASARVGYEIAA
jgi:hypothetical protein